MPSIYERAIAKGTTGSNRTAPSHRTDDGDEGISSQPGAFSVQGNRRSTADDLLSEEGTTVIQQEEEEKQEEEELLVNAELVDETNQLSQEDIRRVVADELNRQRQQERHQSLAAQEVLQANHSPAGADFLPTTDEHLPFPCYVVFIFMTLSATRAAKITAFINNITLSGNVIEYPVPLQVRAATPEERAVAWLIEEDPLQMVTDFASDRARLQQRYALLTFWFSDELDSSWWFDEGWLTANHECDWYGVGCNERIVVAFDMGVYDFEGSSYHGNALGGSIPNDIALLTALEHLDLQANHYMTGTIPTTLGDLKELRYVNFWNIGFSPCPLPPLGKLTNLEHLDLGATYSLTGGIPENINSLTKLTYLDLQNAKLSGTIPSTIGDLTLLEYLNIEDNPKIIGTIPETLYGLLQLKELKLGSTGLWGTISDSLGKLSSLERFWIGSNSLTGSLPPAIGSLTNVKNFYVHNNNLIGTLPNTIGQWTAVTHVLFNSNSFRGTIPASIGNWVDIERAAFHDNGLTGTVPDSICSHITGDDDLYADCKSDVVCSCCTKCY